MSKLVTIYGGSGFVGRYIAQRMAQMGWRVRVAVRRDVQFPQAPRNQLRNLRAEVDDQQAFVVLYIHAAE